MFVKLTEAIIAGNVFTDRHERLAAKQETQTQEVNVNPDYVVTTRAYVHTDGKQYTKVETIHGEIIVVGAKSEVDKKLTEGKQLLKG